MSAASPPIQCLRRSQRLIHPRLFRETFAQQDAWVGRCMVLWVRRAPDAALRVGVVASRKVGNAVMRNRARRRLREAWRLNRHAFTGTVDVVLVGRRPVTRASLAAVTAELLRLAERAGLRAADANGDQLA